MPTLMDFAERVEATRLGTAVAESTLAFPIIEGVHLIGLSIAVGLLFFTDLRMMGLCFTRIPLQSMLQQLRPWILGGFACIFVSGGLLFLAEATMLVDNPAFAWKLLFIAFAGLNAGYFEFVVARRLQADAGTRTLRNVKYAGFASLSLWTLVIVSGRLIPYISG